MCQWKTALLCSDLFKFMHYRFGAHYYRRWWWRKKKIRKNTCAANNTNTHFSQWNMFISTLNWNSTNIAMFSLSFRFHYDRTSQPSQIFSPNPVRSHIVVESSRLFGIGRANFKFRNRCTSRSLVSFENLIDKDHFFWIFKFFVTKTVEFEVLLNFDRNGLTIFGLSFSTTPFF